MTTNRVRCRIILLLSCLLVVSAWSQTPTFRPMMTGSRVTAVEAVDGRIYAGLNKGGVVEWDPQTQSTLRNLTRADGLGGHFVHDIAWSGQKLWIATAEGGLTAITDPGGPAESMKRYNSALSSMDINAVSAQMVGNTERVYYGTNGDGIGEIASGLPGAFYTTLDGLIDDTVIDLALTDGQLIIATPSGLSRFADNSFINETYAEAGIGAVNALEVTADGRVWAATDDGVARWDPSNGVWEHVAGGTNTYLDLAVAGDVVFGLSSFNTVVRIDGETITSPALPAAPDGLRSRSYVLVVAGEDIWAGGDLADSDPLYSGSLARQCALVRLEDPSGEIHTFDTCRMGAGGGFDGVAIDASGRAWLGDREGDGLAAFDGDHWYNVGQRATAANDSLGLFDVTGGLLAMAADGDDIWFNQFSTGVIRFRPAATTGGVEQWDLMKTEDSPLQGDMHLCIAVHPDGPVFFGTNADDWGGTDNSVLGADILLDGDHWRRDDAWMHVDAATLGGNLVTAIAFERRDVVWFAVSSVGLVRWDVNGRNNGPDAPLTWTDPSDDWWSPPLSGVVGSDLELKATTAIIAGDDGTIWAGGEGVTHFSYEPSLDLFDGVESATLLGDWDEKEYALVEGLLSKSVEDLVWDRNGDIWALTARGLNRMRLDGVDVTIDGYTDLSTYFFLDSSLYSASIIQPLPGGTYRHLAASADGAMLVLSSDLGGCAVDVPSGGANGGEDLDAVYLYPNPFPGDDGATSLSLGDLDLSDDAPATVEIFNMQGQLVYRVQRLEQAVSFWDGRNRQGRRVASGLYVVKVDQAGRTQVQTLAVTY